jgi:hypothetical protein
MNNLTNRIKRLEIELGNTTPPDPVFMVIFKGHLLKSNDNVCLLCGSNSFSRMCEMRLTDEQLHLYMENNPNEYALLVDDNYQYTGFEDYADNWRVFTSLV